MTRTPKHNVIVFTGGLNGSSVLAGLLARAGYWLGDETKKVAYETFENSDLVDLNSTLLNETGHAWRSPGYPPPPSIDKLRKLHERRDNADAERLLAHCDRHEPWLWKDPRLCFTMFYWIRLRSFESSKAILMARDLRQAWTGAALRGKSAIPYGVFRTTQGNIMNAARQVIAESSLDCMELTFEDLIVDPERSIERVNRFLDVGLTLDDFKQVYRGTLYRPRWKRSDYVYARLKSAARVLRGGVVARSPSA
jgi:hypothetical protein